MLEEITMIRTHVVIQNGFDISSKKILEHVFVSTAYPSINELRARQGIF